MNQQLASPFLPAKTTLFAGVNRNASPNSAEFDHDFRPINQQLASPFLPAKTTLFAGVN